MEISKRHLSRLIKKQREVYINSLNSEMGENIQPQSDKPQSSCVKRTKAQDALDEAEAGNPQSSCAKRAKKQDALDEVKEELAKVKEFVRGKLEQMEQTQLAHNKAIMAALAEQKVVLQKLIRQESIGAPMAAFFPLKYEQDLKNIEDKILPDNREMYVATIKRKLQPDAAKNLKNIFSDEIFFSHNVEGTHGKKSFKSYEQFYAALLDSISQLPNVDNAEDQLRKAIQLHKKRIHKRNSTKNTGLQSPFFISFNERDELPQSPKTENP